MFSIVVLYVLILQCLFLSETKGNKLNLDTQITNQIENNILFANEKDINAKAKKSQILDTILGGSYDMKLRPLGKNDTGPVEIGLSMYLVSIDNLDDIDMEYTVQLICRQEWIDPRLIYYQHIKSSDNNNNTTYLQMMDTSRIWVPDLVFSNEKTGSLHKLMFPNVYVRIFPNGQILWGARITLKLSCAMDLHYYPMDLQSCKIIMGSFGWTSNDLIFKWNDGSDNIDISKGINLPRFQLLSYINSTCESLVTRTGSYDCIELQLEFKREFGYYLIQIYIPCIMLVMVSWVEFWLEPTATEARISLCVTSILTVVTQTYGINASVPPASYIKAIDVWLFTIQFMVFTSILEFAYVNYLARFHWKKIIKSMIFYDENLKNEKEIYYQEKGHKKAKRVDTLSKIIFPTIFIIFNIIYWSVYLNPKKEDTSHHEFYKA